MRKFFEILIFSAFIGFINFCVNPNKPAYIKEISFGLLAKNSDWIFIDTQTNDENSEKLFSLNESNFESQISVFLDLWTPEKKVGILQNQIDIHSNFKIAKKLKNDFGIDEVYIVKEELKR